MKYQVKIRFKGHVSWVEVDANNASQAKELVRQQYGPEVDVIYCQGGGKIGLKETGNDRTHDDRTVLEQRPCHLGL